MPSIMILYQSAADWPPSLPASERHEIITFALLQIYVRQKRNRQGIHTGGMKPEFTSALVQQIVANHDGLKAIGLYPISVIMNHSCRLHYGVLE